MVRVRRLLIIRHVASAACRRSPSELIVQVAGIAGQCRVCAGQGVTSELQVVKTNAEPSVETVALFASCREPGGGVARTGSRLKIFRVTGIAGGLETLELTHRSALMAGVAIQRRMRSHQGKTILVVLDLLHRNLPAFHGVALFASGAELALVNVGVALGTLCRHIGKHQLSVAGHARHFFVHAPQRIFRLIVIKFGHAADRLPSTKRVAVLARDIQRPVRTPGGCAGWPGRYTYHTHQHQEDQRRGSPDCSQATLPQKARKNGVALRHEFPLELCARLFKNESELRRTMTSGLNWWRSD